MNHVFVFLFLYFICETLMKCNILISNIPYIFDYNQISFHDNQLKLGIKLKRFFLTRTQSNALRYMVTYNMILLKLSPVKLPPVKLPAVKLPPESKFPVKSVNFCKKSVIDIQIYVYFTASREYYN